MSAPDRTGTAAASADSDLPTPPPGWRTGPPDYVGVGTAGSGTGWWHSLIVQHPQVAQLPGRPAALHFFDDGWQREPDEADRTRYHAMFPRPPGAHAGEWTPEYLEQAWTPPLLRRAAPDTHLLVMLRDPAARFRVQMTGPRDRPSGDPTPRAAANAAFSHGLYADQLSRLWRAFPRGQVLVLQYERCLADPLGELRRTFAFLGLPPDATADIDPGGHVDGAAAADPVLSDWQTEQLARHYAPENARLAALLPDLDLALWLAPR